MQLIFKSMDLYELHSIHESICFYLTHTSRNIRNAITKHFQKNGIKITSEQLPILMILWQKDGRFQYEFSSLISKEKTTITRLINNLEAKNLIVRIPDRQDRRNNLIYLTNEGKLLKDKLIPLTKEIQQKAIEGFTPEELELLKKFLIRINENVGFKIEK